MNTVDICLWIYQVDGVCDYAQEDVIGLIDDKDRRIC